MRVVSASEAVKCIQSKNNVFVHSVAAAPRVLIDALMQRAPELRDVNMYHVHTEGPAPYAMPDCAASFNTNAFFVGANVRSAVAAGDADYIPVFLSEIPALFRGGTIPLDVAMIQVSTPDRHGFCSLGVSVDIARAAIDAAKIVIAQINPHMPRSHGDGLISTTEIHYAVEHGEPLLEIERPILSDIEQAIGRHVAGLVENGATLQMGIGAIPDAVLGALGGHRDLGVHTEMFSDGLIDLVESGVVNGRCKTIYPERIVSGFVMGSKRVYDFIDDNPQVAMLDIAFVNNTAVISQNPKVTAINSAIEVDITGQVCADSIGTRQYSGVGGQMDFIRGASLSRGGKPIIALPSTTRKGESRIVPFLKPGAGVVTTRAHVHYVVTEYGAVNLYGKTLRQRARALIGIAHPDHREALQAAAFERFHTI